MKILRVVLLLVLSALPPRSRRPRPAPPVSPAPGPRPTRTASGPSATTRSQVWHTLDDGALTEVYYPDLGTPAVRDLQFAVSDGRTLRRARARGRRPPHRAGRPALADLPPGQLDRPLPDHQDLRHRPGTQRAGDRRPLPLADRQASSALYTLFDPALSNDGDNDSGSTAADALVDAGRRTPAARSPPRPRFTRTSNGYLGHERRLDRPRL